MPPSAAPTAKRSNSSGWSGRARFSAKKAVTSAAQSVAIVQSDAMEAGASGETASSRGRSSVVGPMPESRPKKALTPLRIR